MKSKIEKIGYFLVPSSTSEGVTDALQSLADKLNEIIDYLNSQAQPEENEPEKVYVDPIVPNFTEELSAPVEYKTKEEVKRMFEPEKKGWRKEWEDLFSLEYGYPTWEEVPIYKKEILDLIQQELDKAREEVGFNNDEISRITLLIKNAEVGDIADAQLDMQILDKLSKLKQ